MKFGGSVLRSPQSFSAIAELIAARRGERTVIVVSALEGMTDQLIALAHRVHPTPPTREMDMLVSVGERISIALLAMALSRLGLEGVSFTGSQSGIITTSEHTEARIVDVRPYRLIPHLERGKIAIVAGFQGVSREKEITTLGRGGGDTTAVALGIALGAQEVIFVKDVPGIFSAHPSNPKGEKIEQLSYEEALEVIARTGEVLHPRAIALAAKNGIPLKVRNIDEEGSVICGSIQRKRVEYEERLPESCHTF